MSGALENTASSRLEEDVVVRVEHVERPVGLVEQVGCFEGESLEVRSLEGLPLGGAPMLFVKRLGVLLVGCRRASRL